MLAIAKKMYGLLSRFQRANKFRIDFLTMVFFVLRRFFFFFFVSKQEWLFHLRLFQPTGNSKSEKKETMLQTHTHRSKSFTLEHLIKWRSAFIFSPQMHHLECEHFFAHSSVVAICYHKKMYICKTKERHSILNRFNNWRWRHLQFLIWHKLENSQYHCR